METRLSNIFKSTSVTNLAKIIQESSYRVAQVKSKWKGRWILPYFWHSNWHYFGYISGKVAKLHFLEISQNTPTFISIGPLIAKSWPFKHMKKLCFFGKDFFFKKKLLTFGQRFIIFEKLRYGGQLLLKLRAVEVATSFHWISSIST